MQRERLANLQHRRGVGDVLRRRAPVAVLAEPVAAQRVELRHDTEDRVADALGLRLQLVHVDLADVAVAHDLVRCFRGMMPSRPCTTASARSIAR